MNLPNCRYLTIERELMYQIFEKIFKKDKNILDSLFSLYSNKYEIVHGLKISSDFLNLININSTRTFLKSNNLNFVFKFDNKNSLEKLCIKNWLNYTVDTGFLGDYIVKDEKGIYILNKIIFEKRYKLFSPKEKKSI